MYAKKAVTVHWKLHLGSLLDVQCTCQMKPDISKSVLIRTNDEIARQQLPSKCSKLQIFQERLKSFLIENKL